VIRSIYPAPAFAAAIPTAAFIPPITDPLGRHWDQPKDMCDVEFDDTHVLLTQAQFDGLADYSRSQPSGVYPGKCWKIRQCETVVIDGMKRLRFTDKWSLCWFGKDETWPKYCTNNYREIIIT
jgi:hypothetical protein